MSPSEFFLPAAADGCCGVFGSLHGYIYTYIYILLSCPEADTLFFRCALYHDELENAVHAMFMLLLLLLRIREYKGGDVSGRAFPKAFLASKRKLKETYERTAVLWLRLQAIGRAALFIGKRG